VLAIGVAACLISADAARFYVESEHPLIVAASTAVFIIMGAASLQAAIIKETFTRSKR